MAARVCRITEGVSYEATTPLADDAVWHHPMTGSRMAQAGLASRHAGRATHVGALFGAILISGSGTSVFT
jgi:ribulose 1,5-bisphosphate synthetase/thiazole synthase